MSWSPKKPPASVRHLNPGAQWPGPIASKWGSTGHEVLNDGLGQGNKIATFPSWENGAAAHIDLLRTKYTGMPLGSAIQKWSDGNHSGEYANRVARETGLSPDTIVSEDLLKSPAGLSLVQSMAQHEAGRGGAVPAAAWGRAQAMVFGGKPPQEITEPDDARVFLSESKPMPVDNKPRAPASPMFVQGAGETKSPYSRELAKALLNSKLSNHVTPVEGVAHALAKGFGAYDTINAEQEDKAKVAKLVASMPAEYQAIAQVDPKHAYQMMIQESREKSAADRQANQFNAQIAADDRRSANSLALAEKNAALERANKIATGGKIETDTRTGQKFIAFPDGTQRPLQAPAGQPPAPAAPAPSAPSAPAPGGVQRMSMDGGEAALQPVATPPAANEQKKAPSYGSRVKVNADGTAKLGPRTVNVTRPDGEYVSKHVFTHAVEDAPDEVSEKRNWDNSRGYAEAQEKYYIPAAREGSKNIEMLDQFIKLNAGTPTGWGGDLQLMATQMADRFGLTGGSFSSPMEAMNSMNMMFSKAVKEGLPGAVSNYEQQLFKAAAPNISNTPMGNWLVAEAMKSSGRRAVQGGEALNGFLEEKKSAGLSATIDRGFEGYKAEYADKTGQSTLSPYAEKALKLLGQGKKAEAEAMYNDYLRAEHGIDKTAPAGKKRAVSSDGTVPAAPKTTIAVETIDGKQYRVTKDANGAAIDVEAVK